MKYFFSIILLSSIFLSSCSIDWNDEKDKKIIVLEQQIQNDLFKKKQECIKMESLMKVQLEEIYSYRTSNSRLSLTEIFYSPIKNSCLYKSEFSSGNDSILLGLQDYLTKETIIEAGCDVSVDSIKSGQYISCTAPFREKLTELKGE